MLRVTVDTNVIISALNFPGNPARILEMAEAGTIHIAVSDAIINEVERVLRRPKFGWLQERIDGAIRGLLSFTEHVERKTRVDIVQNDPTDNLIIECALASGSEYLVSGDKHLFAVGRYQGVRIVAPAEFVEIQAPHKRVR